MFTPQDIEIIKKELSPGTVTEIHRKTGISKPTIYRFFRGARIRSHFKERIYMAALKILEQEKIKADRIIKKRLQVLGINPEYDLKLSTEIKK